MISIIDFQKRSLTGPVMKTDEFDLGLSMRVRELVPKYGIKYNPEELVVDDATADAVFHAGVDLLTDVGLYHLDTHRVVRFTREEIEGIAGASRKNPGRCTFGRGKDEITVEYRTGADTRPPVLYAGPAGVAGEGWFASFVQSFAQEDAVKAMGIAPGLERLGDIEPKAGTPSEIFIGHWEQRQIKDVLRRVGRPDMHCGLLSTVSTVGGTMAMIGPGLREAHNTQIGVHILPEQKLDWARLILAQFCQDRGIAPWQSAMSMIGGLCRDAADTAVVVVANLLGQLAYAHGPMCSIFTNHMDGSWGTPSALWAYSAAGRASERNIRLCIGGVAACSTGLGMTEAQLLHAAAIAILNTASGMSYCWIAGPTGLDARLLGEVMGVTAGMKPGKANTLIRAILLKVEGSERSKPLLNVPFPDMYDVNTVRPKPDYESMLLRAKDELSRLGVPY